MLSNHKITIVADTSIDDVKIASYSAILNVDSNELTLSTRYVDKEACKINRETVRADQNTFEDYAYSLQDMLKE